MPICLFWLCLFTFCLFIPSLAREASTDFLGAKKWLSNCLFIMCLISICLFLICLFSPSLVGRAANLSVHILFVYILSVYILSSYTFIGWRGQYWLSWCQGTSRLLGSSSVPGSLHSSLDRTLRCGHAKTKTKTKTKTRYHLLENILSFGESRIWDAAARKFGCFARSEIEALVQNYAGRFVEETWQQKVENKTHWVGTDQ